MAYRVPAAHSGCCRHTGAVSLPFFTLSHTVLSEIDDSKSHLKWHPQGRVPASSNDQHGTLTSFLLSFHQCLIFCLSKRTDRCFLDVINAEWVGVGGQMTRKKSHQLVLDPGRGLFQPSEWAWARLWGLSSWILPVSPLPCCDSYEHQ